MHHAPVQASFMFLFILSFRLHITITRRSTLFGSDMYI